MITELRSNLQPQAGSGGSSPGKRNFTDQKKKKDRVEKISIIDKTLIAIQNSKRTKNFMFCHLSLCIMLEGGIIS